MIKGEFNLIAQYFSRPVPDNYLGGGDDCALFPVQPGMQVAISTDTLIEGRHFLRDSDARLLGHKALAVNLSDLAAMGAEPVSCVLALSLPKIDEAWLAAFSEGLYALADAAACPLVGGDTTRSTDGIVIGVTVCGQVEPALAMRRSGARPGDDIWVSGQLGAAYIALQQLTATMAPDNALLDATRGALEQPRPPLAFARQLRYLAHAAIDISDGLLQDLGHILKASSCGASLWYSQLPAHPALADLPPPLLQQAVLAGGDVYQLCFTAAPEQRQAIVDLAAATGTQLSRVGEINTEPGLAVFDASGQVIQVESGGFDHFKDTSGGQA